MSAIEMTNLVKANQSGNPPEVKFTLNGTAVAASQGELLVEAIRRHKEIPHICYNSPLMGPIQTCDTCIVEVDARDPDVPTLTEATRGTAQLVAMEEAARLSLSRHCGPAERRPANL
jgi:predicted molibdopterin-dependent oxidoreductase YjgC